MIATNSSIAVPDLGSAEAPRAMVAFEVQPAVAALPIATTLSAVPVIEQPAAETQRGRVFTELATGLDQARAMLERLGPELAQSGLLTALETRTPQTYDHTWRVAESTVALGRVLGLSPLHLRDLRTAALFHDIGKIAIPLRVLERSGPLTDEEMAVLRLHVTIGADLLAGIPALAALAPVVAATHERYDGSGYPRGLAGSAIPLGARIIAVADAHDAMTARRPYGTPLSRTDANSELERCSGTHFDPEVVQAWLHLTHAVSPRRLARHGAVAQA